MWCRRVCTCSACMHSSLRRLLRSWRRKLGAELAAKAPTLHNEVDRSLQVSTDPSRRELPAAQRTIQLNGVHMRTTTTWTSFSSSTTRAQSLVHILRRRHCAIRLAAGCCLLALHPSGTLSWSRAAQCRLRWAQSHCCHEDVFACFHQNNLKHNKLHFAEELSAAYHPHSHSHSCVCYCQS